MAYLPLVVASSSISLVASFSEILSPFSDLLNPLWMVDSTPRASSAYYLELLGIPSPPSFSVSTVLNYQSLIKRLCFALPSF
jgi:hypothetical protein